MPRPTDNLRPDYLANLKRRFQRDPLHGKGRVGIPGDMWLSSNTDEQDDEGWRRLVDILDAEEIGLVAYDDMPPKK